MNTSEKAQEFTLLGDRTKEQREFGDNLYRDFLKRGLDLGFAILLLPLVLPILLLLIALIKLDSRGPAFFKSERIGKYRNRFHIFKLRTMCLDADYQLNHLLNNNQDLKTEWERDHKLKNDPRITKVGKIIRALSLDELPQIFNVLKGEMSFVGPRPIVEAEIYRYKGQFQYYQSVLPGVTGLWQINGRNDTSYEERVALDVRYCKEITIQLDLSIIIKTVPVIFFRKGAY